MDMDGAFHMSTFVNKNAKQKQPRAVKKGAAKQSRIKSINSLAQWHLRWLVKTRADIIITVIIHD